MTYEDVFIILIVVTLLLVLLDEFRGE